MSSEPVPQRLSDADRDAAVELLREHFEAGRLEEAEFTERMQTALAARVALDLEALFGDLPDPRPSFLAEYPPALEPGTPGVSSGATWASALVPRPDAGVPATWQTWVPMARKLVWPAAIILLITTGSWIWIPFAIVASIVLRQVDTGQRRPPPYL